MEEFDMFLDAPGAPVEGEAEALKESDRDRNDA